MRQPTTRVRAKQKNNCLAVIIPCFNEESTIHQIVTKVLQQEIVGEVIIVDDSSTDSSMKILKAIKDKRVSVLSLPKNKGKGNAIAVGIGMARKPYVIIQDADLEYDPSEYEKIIAPLVSGLADVVYGSRFLTGGPRRALYFWHRVGNNFLTLLSNMVTNLDLTDMETCYKAMRTDIAQSVKLREKRFGVEPEITAKLAHKNLKIFEVPISYNGRTYAEGKKINYKDGFSALRCIIKYGLLRVN
jgi:glycosyltransferase involved in cell wall biosynthesis